MTPFQQQEIDKWLVEQNAVLNIIRNAENRLAFCEQLLDRLMNEAGVKEPDKAPRHLYLLPSVVEVT